MANMSEIWLVAIVGAAVICLFVLLFGGKCSWCGTKMVQHKDHWNIRVCPNCGKMEVNDG